MTGKEYFTRRDSLVALSISSLAIIVPYLKIRSPHYLAYLDYQLKEGSFIRESDLSPYIFTTNEREQNAVKVNIGTFSDALSLIANREVESYGRLKRFIILNPLRIHLQEHLPKIEAEDGRLFEPSGNYSGVLFGGPIVRFTEAYLKKYAKSVQSGDRDGLANADTLIYHELTHFWQDFRNPYKHFWYTGYCTNLEEPNTSVFHQKTCPEDNVLEDEAWDKSKQIVQSLRAGYMSGKKEKWPFGHFFFLPKCLGCNFSLIYPA